MNAIEGVQLVGLTVFADERGSFTESYRREWFDAGREMVQANVSRSKAGVLRGLHVHRRQADCWFIVDGEAFVALHDLRAGSPTAGVTATMTLTSAEPAALFIPPGVAHGFYAVTDVVLQYLVDEYFDGSDEHGIAWNDPDLAIAWPAADPVLSERDRANPSLAAIRWDPPPS
jgi:dTDP-4-dehydrorhamnose 3,5-epimerase